MKKSTAKTGKKKGTTVKKATLNRVTKLNRAPLKTQPKNKTQYMVMAEWVKKHSGQYSKKEIIEHLEKPPYSITPGTSSTTFCQFMNKRYKPDWAKLEMTIDKEGRVHLE